jgi:hypothetical protein
MRRDSRARNERAYQMNSRKFCHGRNVALNNLSELAGLVLRFSTLLNLNRHHSLTSLTLLQ